MQSASASVGSAGCGLGSLVFTDNEWWMQVLAATVNSTGVQTFGITSGTSNFKVRQKMTCGGDLMVGD